MLYPGKARRAATRKSRRSLKAATMAATGLPPPWPRASAVSAACCAMLLAPARLAHRWSQAALISKQGAPVSSWHQVRMGCQGGNGALGRAPDVSTGPIAQSPGKYQRSVICVNDCGSV